jgi:hypothetical protein
LISLPTSATKKPKSDTKTTPLTNFLKKMSAKRHCPNYQRILTTHWMGSNVLLLSYLCRSFRVILCLEHVFFPCKIYMLIYGMYLFFCNRCIHLNFYYTVYTDEIYETDGRELTRGIKRLAANW